MTYLTQLQMKLEKCDMRRRGSITIFASMVIMLVINFLFALLEASRYTELNKLAEMRSSSDIESVFSQYCVPLYEEYGLLGYDCQGSSIEGYLASLTADNFCVERDYLGMKHLNLLRLDLETADVQGYTLITDGNGMVYEAAVASYMKENIAYGTAKAIYDTYIDSVDIGEANKDVGENVDNAMAELEKLEAGEDDDSSGGVETIKKTDESEDAVADDTFASVQKSKASGVLTVVLGKEAEVSGSLINLSNSVSNRELKEGANKQIPENDWFDYVCLEQYILKNMGNYISPKEGRALQYEVEYIIAGKSSDSDNFKAVVNELLLAREAANFMYLQRDVKKKEEALVLATAIAGASANPAVIEAVKIGLLTSWAYCESVLDLRTLLSGERIPIVKTPATWTSTLSGMGEFLSGFAKAKSSAVGLNYTDYVGTMIMLQSVSTISYRTMDLQELTIRKKDGYQNFRMDQAMCNMDMTVYYTHNSLFFNKVSLISKVIAPYEIPEETTYTYFKY